MSKTKSNGLTFKHKFGYALGDAGGCMTFAIMGSSFTMYCTDALGLNTALIAVLFAIWNVWDFINDPLMGALMDKPLQNITTKGANSVHGYFALHQLCA